MLYIGILLNEHKDPYVCEAGSTVNGPPCRAGWAHLNDRVGGGCLCGGAKPLPPEVRNPVKPNFVPHGEA